MFKIVAFSIVFGASGVAAHAATYDAARDFSAFNNPNGQWSYSYSASTANPADPTAFRLAVLSNNTQVDFGYYWSAPDGKSARTSREYSGNLLDATPRDYNVVLRFTAPTAGSYQLGADYYSQNNGGTANVFIAAGGSNVFTGSVVNLGPEVTYRGNTDLTAGEIVDFTITTRSLYYDAYVTLLDSAPTTSVPEPISGALLLVGMTAAALVRRKHDHILED